MKKKLIDIKDLTIQFPKKNSRLFEMKREKFNAVDHVSFYIKKGETFGLVGESGSGKSTVGLSILRYHTPFCGEIRYDGTDIARLNNKELLPYRKKMQSVFQDPYSSLNPGMTVLDIIAEPMRIHKIGTRKEREERAAELLETVGLTKKDLLKYPHEFSGGQRQRISIARALCVHPEFILCDEPISALDVSLQTQIIELLEELQDKMGLTYLFISHQLQVVEKICDEIGVMYLGSLLEISDRKKLFAAPLHPYTRLLLSAMLVPDPHVDSLANIKEDTGNRQYREKGCKFALRCPYAEERCQCSRPELIEVEEGHFVACFQYKGR